MEWQPIETAPKDGSRFLGWDRLNDEASICFYSEGAGDPAFVGFFHVGDWLGGASLSHWMPLPPPPNPKP